MLDEPPAEVRAHGGPHGHLVEHDRAAVRRPLGRARHHLRIVRELAEARAVGMDHVDVGRLHVLPLAGGAGIALVGKPGAAVGAEGDHPPVGRPARPEVAARGIGEVADLAAREVHDVDVGGAAAAGRDEGQRAVVRRQRRLVVEGRGLGQPLQAAAVDPYSVDVGRPAPVRGEHHPPAVVGERRVVVDLHARHELARVAPVRVGDHELGPQRHVLVDVDAVELLRLGRRAGRQDGNDERHRGRYGSHRRAPPRSPGGYRD